MTKLEEMVTEANELIKKAKWAGNDAAAFHLLAVSRLAEAINIDLKAMEARIMAAVDGQRRDLEQTKRRADSAFAAAYPQGCGR